MTNEEEQITLNIDLYDNIMTEKEGDYTGRPRITGTLYNKQIAARIVKAGTEYKQESIEYILDRADKAKVEAIAEGKSVIDGVGQYLVTARGSFIGENAQFDPVKHSLGVSYTPGQLLRSQLKKTKVVCNGTAKTGPAGPAVISCSNAKVIGDDPSVGVFLTKDEEGAAPMKCPVIIRNAPSELTVMLPAIETKVLYTLSVTTQYSSSNKMLKNPRTYRFPILLSDGKSNDEERPGEL